MSVLVLGIGLLAGLYALTNKKDLTIVVVSLDTTRARGVLETPLPEPAVSLAVDPSTDGG